MNCIVYPLETCIYNLSGGRAHYETLTIEMLVLKKIKCHLLGAIRLIWLHLPCHESGV
jgi:hypothetical protein